MQLPEALGLIKNDHLPPLAAAQWADLGCGSGLFTSALARLLPAGSMVYAVDKDPVALHISTSTPGVGIKTMQLDFVTETLGLHDLDGILMANSLHYVQDKKALIRKLSGCMKPEARFLIVEYDIETPVKHWVPYPLSFRALKELFHSAGYTLVEKLGERPSSFGRGMLYGALVAP